jgi:hypothetical protein
MACFTFDRDHNLGVCLPPNKTVVGSFNPELDGPGDYTVRLHCELTSQIIAEGLASSPSGAAVPMNLPHAHLHPGGRGVFQCNIKCQFDEGPVGVPTPKCLRND